MFKFMKPTINYLLKHDLGDHLDGQSPGPVDLLHGLLGQLGHQLPDNDVTDKIRILLQDLLVKLDEYEHAGLPDPGADVAPPIRCVILDGRENALENSNQGRLTDVIVICRERKRRNKSSTLLFFPKTS